ncbi:MAG: hypothetical protein FGM55_07215 [Rhodoferax sp.]|nr:hypothetical protein [Rhodoferax sp.]
MSSLYLDHFGLKKPPFQITPDPGFFFSGGRRGDILSALVHVACEEEGIAIVVAEVGSGKTLLARLMIEQLPTDICTIYLANPCFGRDEIIAAISRDLGLKGQASTLENMIAVLQQELLRRHASGQRIVLVIDEAHTMPSESLEEVRLLSNIETGQHKLINIMLFGQPELDQLLNDTRLRQVKDRVVHRFDLESLHPDEVSSYVDHRLRAAGWTGGRLFSADAIAQLARISGGRARRINLLADKALLAAYAQGRQRIEAPDVRHAEQDLPGAQLPSSRRPWLRRDSWRVPHTRVILGLSAVIVLAAALYGWLKGQAPDVAASGSRKPPVASLPGTGATDLRPALRFDPQLPLRGNTPVAPPRDLDMTLRHSVEWIGQTSSQSYTIQIASLDGTRDPSRGFLSLRQELIRQFDANRIYAQAATYSGKPYVFVYAGDFETTGMAQMALQRLPTSVLVNQPLVVTWQAVKRRSE